IAQLSGRAHIPEGFTLPAKPLITAPAQYETTGALVGATDSSSQRTTYSMECSTGPRDVHLSFELSQITWVWWNQADHLGFGKTPQVSVGDQVLEV
ncbi:MAG: hypothetical protein OSB38_40040, partial [Paraburkholderia fungorum]|nr:hypothetical protein [Paraburkholderia fungorum]